MSSTGIDLSSSICSGSLYKWASYLKGYQKRWFVLQNGQLSYYRSQSDFSNSNARGSISILNAFIHTQDSSSFIVSDGSTRTYHLKCSSKHERQRWVTAIELAKIRAIDQIESDEYDFKFTVEPPDKNELNQAIHSLGTKLENVRLCHELVAKHGTALQKQLSDLEESRNNQDAAYLIRSINERANLFRITVNALISASDDYLGQAKTQGSQWIKLFQREHEQRCNLEDMVEELGKQHSHLENRIRRSLIPVVDKEEKDAHRENLDSDCEDCFVDALEVLNPTSSGNVFSRSESGDSDLSRSMSVQELPIDNSDVECNEPMIQLTTATEAGSPLVLSTQTDLKKEGTSDMLKCTRRSKIPDKPNVSINIWSIMKNCIGKELSKIPLPVNFSEPLSFLQRLTEDFEYSDCLDRAAECEDSCLQMAYVAAYTVSAYANTTERTGKPFNPLLGETFECDRMSDYGWRSIAEQVSHHPPMVAMHTEGRAWISWQEFTMTTKFRGKYLQILPLGTVHLMFPKTGNHYTWRKVLTTVHNIIVGQLWVDNHGETDIVNHKTGDQCHLKYNAYSYFSKDTPRKVSGVIKNQLGAEKLFLSGSWDSEMSVSEIIADGEITKRQGKSSYSTAGSKQLWKRRKPPPELVKCYNFTQLAVELNEPEPGVAPTDSRLRPDQRLMEQGAWDEANDVKMQLEEKQRTARRRRDSLLEEAAQSGQDYSRYKPKWFSYEKDLQTGNMSHVSTGEYWICKQKQDWSRCPDIFL